jgi:hypothetical protein
MLAADPVGWKRPPDSEPLTQAKSTVTLSQRRYIGWGVATNSPREFGLDQVWILLSINELRQGTQAVHDLLFHPPLDPVAGAGGRYCDIVFRPVTLGASDPIGSHIWIGCFPSHSTRVDVAFLPLTGPGGLV